MLLLMLHFWLLVLLERLLKVLKKMVWIQSRIHGGCSRWGLRIERRHRSGGCQAGRNVRLVKVESIKSCCWWRW
jgi:hypothetical protein